MSRSSSGGSYEEEEDVEEDDEEEKGIEAEDGLGPLFTATGASTGTDTGTGGGRRKSSLRTTKKTGDSVKYGMEFTSKAAEILADAFENTSTTFLNGKYKVCLLSAEDIKGKANSEYNSSTKVCTITFYYKLKVRFEVHWEGNIYRGRILLIQMSKEKLAIEDFPYDILWLNGISPRGITYQQVVSLLISPKTRTLIRKNFDDFQRRSITFLQPKLQGFDHENLLHRSTKKENRIGSVAAEIAKAVNISNVRKPGES